MKHLHIRSWFPSGTDIAFLVLFAAEFTYYLLILQTGVVAYHHSALSEIWMMPAGGIAGIVLSVWAFPQRNRFMPWLLALQLVLSADYAHAGVMVLFVLGILSGLTAPLLLYRMNTLAVAVTGLGLSYVTGTMLFHIEAAERTWIAVLLSAVALIASLFAKSGQERKSCENNVTLYTMATVFLWLLLDAALFETLSRDALMHLWGEHEYVWTIILFHLIGLVVAYRMRQWSHNDLALVILFVMAYAAYSSGDKTVLSVVYPFVISYYNVAILHKLIRMGYLPLAVVSLSLWGASGLGLLIALGHLFTAAWILLGLLALLLVLKYVQIRLPFGTAIHFTSMKG